MPSRRKGTQADISLAARTESCAGGAQNCRMFQQKVKAIAACHPLRACDPKIRGMLPAEKGQGKVLQGFSESPGILQRLLNGLLRLLLPPRRQNGCGGALHGITNAVRLCKFCAFPHGIQALPAPVQRAGHNGIAAAQPREPCAFGKRADLNGTAAAAFHFKD